ncbi:MAG: HAMP domain-containing sensor histidine kinase [Eubacteriales bacterium]|nr:HAMP domain-containing sensor histidine kinase [Eubacteriales bacterium]
MTAAKLSVNKACMIVCALLVLLSASMITALYLLTDNINVIWSGLLFSILVFFCLVLFIILIRRKLTAFSDTLCQLLDYMMTGEIEPPQIMEEESLFYKINHRLARLYEVMRENRRSIAKERADLQELISDISHQVKTPIANLKMVNSTLLEQSMPEEKRKEFLSACGGQLDKLDFLMQAMIKTSRLETGVISLEKKQQSIYDTLAAALGGILLNAEQKHITVDVDCKESLEVSHDPKWTSEALFNILDNAVKYTPNGGCIRVAVETWEMYLKIDIADTGKGILENHQAEIFKRFYREKEVHDTPGIGIGLYLAHEIITMQGGYIKVASETGQGSTFSVFLPRE